MHLVSSFLKKRAKILRIVVVALKHKNLYIVKSLCNLLSSTCIYHDFTGRFQAELATGGRGREVRTH